MHQQAKDLEALVALELNEADTVEQITALQRLSAQTHTNLLRTERARAEQQLMELSRAGEDALEASGVTHAAQHAELERDAAVAQQHIADLEAQAVQDDQELADVQRRCGQRRPARRRWRRPHGRRGSASRNCAHNRRASSAARTIWGRTPLCSVMTPRGPDRAADRPWGTKAQQDPRACSDGGWSPGARPTEACAPIRAS